MHEYFFPAAGTNIDTLKAKGQKLMAANNSALNPARDYISVEKKMPPPAFYIP